jgi:hypothetical protein
VEPTPAEPISIEPVSLAAVRTLLEPQTAPCLSIYLPTHRNVPDNTVDLPAFRHLVEALEMALSAAHARDAITRLLHPLHMLAADARFWSHTRDGLAVFAASGRARVFLLHRPVQPLALVTSRFHTLPLVRIAAALERFFLLALTSREARVYEGLAWHGTTGDTMGPLDPLPLVGRPGQPAGDALSRADVIDEETFQPHRVQRGVGIEGVIHGGTGSKQDDIDADTEIFLRHVDTVLGEQVSGRVDRPVVLVATARLAAEFQRLSRNPHLLADHAAKDPHLMSTAELAAAVQPILAAARDRRIARLVAVYEQARDRDQAAGDLADIARAAVAGRVATLLIEADRFEPGQFDRATGAVETDGEQLTDLSRRGDAPAIRTPDLFGALAESVLEHRGEIVALARNAMPTESGVAAIYRW